MEEFWSNLLQSLALEFAPILAVVAIGYLVRVFSGVWADFKLSQPDAANALEQAAKLAVRAAEQAGASEYIQNKKNYAIDMAEHWLLMRGIKVDLELIDAAIEAAVFEEFNRYRYLPLPEPEE